MMAFQGIGQTGSTNLGVVAPGIAEALVATAAGLFAAIPAVLLLQPPDEPREAVRVRDGRLRDGVPEHRREELHLDAEGAADCDAAAAGGRGRGRRVSTSLAEINVVPLVDVMLVLLIIFMVTAPMMQRGIDVNLPVARRASADRGRARRSSRCPRPIAQNRMVYLGDERVRVDVLQERVRQKMETPTDKQVYLRGDGGVQYQELMDVIDRLKAAGVDERRPASAKCAGSDAER